MFIAAFGASGCDKLKARDLLNKGVAAYRDGKFRSVHRGFQKAKDLDPTLMNARLYLARPTPLNIFGRALGRDIRMGEAAIRNSRTFFR